MRIDVHHHNHYDFRLEQMLRRIEKKLDRLLGDEENQANLDEAYDTAIATGKAIDDAVK